MEVTWIGDCVAVFDDVSWMRVEQLPLQSFRGQCRRVQRQCGGCALWLGALCSAVGAHCLVTLTGSIEVEVVWLHAFDAIHPGPHLTFGFGSSLMVGTGALTHTIWSGSSILYRLALGLRTAVPGAKNTLLTACFRLALWTGQFQVVPRALSPFCDMIVHCVNVMSGH